MTRYHFDATTGERTPFTPEEEAAADARQQAAEAAATAEENQRTAQNTLLQTIRQVARSAEGVLVTDLTAAQQRALFAVWLWERGGLANDGTVKPLGQWVRDR